MDDNPTTDEIADMAAFHLGIVRPLMQEYIAWSLGNLASQTGTRPYNTKLSTTEEMRLLRSMYRFQLWSNLFRICPDTQDRHGSQLDGRKFMELQFSFFEPWEVEEIFCIKPFAKMKVDHIFSKIHRDVSPGPPAIPGQQRSMPAGFFDFDNPFKRDCLLNGTIALGLDFLHTVLFKIKDHDHLVSTMRNHIGLETVCFLNNDVIGLDVQNKRRRSKPSLRDRKQGRRDPLPFLGDVVVRGTDTTHPPLAWTLIWEGTYSSLVGYFIKDKIRKWGYVMWDAARLEKAGAKEVLRRQWESDWLGQDPRDLAIT
ncbi:uncharacterized protein AKAW2_61262S [Aspergillus luchuensis]|uniref:Uncharacterized protein n=1 Tax=Aspergillus kawachii TaxID=1069201 RepID=A0A7R7WHA7_ASPKA|nr:uncharacterized protein AKAW2_61262S [Aspergillus luchuensis]BCS02998.1 hypothetical protein AKAW2_61262S [Aspergillus luchuensis]BCS14647.1 hypothetical protein ALUC_61203S [Aspergillus luchuensis]GAA87775.1 hypothetical protein AKAW_05889 [Aspergillus luchuensis IFO 4308]